MFSARIMLRNPIITVRIQVQWEPAHEECGLVFKSYGGIDGTQSVMTLSQTCSIRFFILNECKESVCQPVWVACDMNEKQQSVCSFSVGTVMCS